MCDCIETTDELLVEHNAQLVTTLFGKPRRVCIETYKLNAEVRKRPPPMLANYCPFCGEKYVKEGV